MLKYYQGEIPEAKEWFSREHRYKAVWKSLAEFHHLFGALNHKKQTHIMKQIELGIIKKLDPSAEAMMRLVTSKLTRIEPLELFIKLDNEHVAYTDIIRQDSASQDISFFTYIFQKLFYSKA